MERNMIEWNPDKNNVREPSKGGKAFLLVPYFALNDK